jgi:hypothetical protein
MTALWIIIILVLGSLSPFLFLAWDKKRVRRYESARDLDGLLKVLTSTGSLAKAEAAKALGRMADKGAVGPLVSALKFGTHQLSAWAAWALGEIGDPRAIEPLIEATSRGYATRAAAKSLVLMGGAAVPGLLRALHSKRGTATARERIAAILREIGPENVPDDVSYEDWIDVIQGWWGLVGTLPVFPARTSDKTAIRSMRNAE